MSEPLPDWSQPAPVSYSSPHVGGGILLGPGGLDLIRKIRPWTFFLAIIGFLFSAMTMGLAALILLLGLVKAPGFAAALQGQSPIFVAAFYFTCGFIALIPSAMVLRIGLAIGRLVSYSTPENLEEAIAMQYRFWRLLGILTIVLVFLMILSFFAAIALVASKGV